MNELKGMLKFISFPFLFGVGLVSFLLTKKTSNLGYVSFRYLFVLTNGRINNFHSRMISLFSKQIKEDSNGILGEITSSRIDTIISSIKKNGYYEFDAQLNQEELNSLVHFAENTTSKCIDVDQKGVVYLKEKILFDKEHPVSPRYQFDTSDVIQNEAVRNIIFDPGFRTIASSYLKCEPILDIVTMWWSAPFQKKGASQSAQMYHFDMDRFKFLKFFFYLTDVHTDNGPHCYIRASQNSIPLIVRKDRRLEDKELLNYYPIEDFKEFTGKKGTILAVDTRGLHKGKPLVKDNRLLFQIQFSNSLFGAPYDKMPLQSETKYEKELVEKFPRTYQLMK